MWIKHSFMTDFFLLVFKRCHVQCTFIIIIMVVHSSISLSHFALTRALRVPSRAVHFLVHLIDHAMSKCICCTSSWATSGQHQTRLVKKATFSLSLWKEKCWCLISKRVSVCGWKVNISRKDAIDWVLVNVNQNKQLFWQLVFLKFSFIKLVGVLHFLIECVTEPKMLN